MRALSRSLLPLLAASLACGGDGASLDSGTPPTGSGATITVDAGRRFQTVIGWEAVAQAGHLANPAFPLYRDALYDLAVNELGINRLRLEVRSGAESTRDDWADWRAGRIDDGTWRCRRYATVNDNANPDVADPARFHFAEMDAAMDAVVVPMRQRLQARGERLWLSVNYVAFTRQRCGGGPLVHDDPREYAEFVLATVQHLKSRYGVVPDSWELILEPDNTDFWRGAQIGAALVAASDRLKAAGFGAVAFVGPSTTNMKTAVAYVDGMATVPGAMARLSEISYHRYSGVSDATLRAIADRGRRHGVRTAMLEHIGSGHEDLHADLALGGASAWQQFALAFNDRDDGSQLLVIDAANPSRPVVRMGRRTTFLRQYFRWVRAGAVRVAAGSADAALDPLAFVNDDGRHVVVVKASRGARFTVGGLPAGSYGVAYTTAEEAGVELPAVTIGAGEPVAASIPEAGVVTIYAR